MTLNHDSERTNTDQLDRTRTHDDSIYRAVENDTDLAHVFSKVVQKHQLGAVGKPHRLTA